MSRTTTLYAALLSVALLSGCDDTEPRPTAQQHEALTDELLPSPEALVDPNAELPEDEGAVEVDHEHADTLRAENDPVGANPSAVPWTISPAPECSVNTDCGFSERCDPISTGGSGERRCVGASSTDAECDLGEQCGAGGYCVVLGKGDWDFCESGGCERGHGDCDDTADCEGSLSCMNNIGAAWGYSSGDDVCDYPAGHANYCSAAHPCGGSQGDCDSNAQCAFGLVCKDNRGPEFGFASWVDVCLPLWQ